MSNEKETDYKIFCRDLYQKTWEQEFIIEVQDKTTHAARQAARLAAQRKAIDKVLVSLFLSFRRRYQKVIFGVR